MARKKKTILENLYIESYAAEGKCIAKHNEKIIFVEGAVPGDNVDVFIQKNKKDWAQGQVLNLITPSKNRIDAFCNHFGTCGGCKWQMLEYSLQLTYKEQQVKDQLQRIGKIDVAEYLPILGCDKTTHYRNKLEFTFSNKQYLSREMLNSNESFDKNVLGFHAPKLFDKVIDIEECHLQEEPTNSIKNFIRNYAFENNLSFYDIRFHHGLFRNLIIRISKKGEVLINLIFGEENQSEIEKCCAAISKEFPAITSFYYTINTKMNDTIYDLPIILFSGKKYIEETLEDFRFQISPKSFFQTNSYQAEKLYQIVRQFANLKGTETLYDLYCGTGSIGIFLSKNAKKIIGVETVEDAIEDAKLNARENNIADAHFFAGDVIKICNDAFFKEHGFPDCIILDPPRAGLHNDLIEKLLEIKCPRIVYVSCNPATQARDVNLLKEKYNINRSQAVDMFPHTHHIENVLLLELI